MSRPTVCIVGAGPIGLEAAWTRPDGEVITAVTKGSKAWKELGLWLGAPMMVAGGLLGFAFQWRTILRAFQSILGGSGEKAENEELIAKTEVPMSWFAAGSLVSANAHVANMLLAVSE